MEAAAEAAALRGMIDCNAPLITLPVDLVPVILSSLSLLLLYSKLPAPPPLRLCRGASLPCCDDALEGLQQIS
jgi:hypothetical protein